MRSLLCSVSISSTHSLHELHKELLIQKKAEQTGCGSEGQQSEWKMDKQDRNNCQKPRRYKNCVKSSKKKKKVMNCILFQKCKLFFTDYTFLMSPNFCLLTSS